MPSSPSGGLARRERRRDDGTGELLTLTDLDIVSISVHRRRLRPIRRSRAIRSRRPRPSHAPTAQPAWSSMHSSTRTGSIPVDRRHHDQRGRGGAARLQGLRHAHQPSRRRDARPRPDRHRRGHAAAAQHYRFAAFRDAARPILTACADAVPVPPGSPARRAPDFHVVSEETMMVTIHDYLVKFMPRAGHLSVCRQRQRHPRRRRQ